MSKKHPIVAVTGSSGAGTTYIRRAFENVFRREHIKPA
ncbi:MAG: phosphoribulokinase, partial [Gammaproteobacteria bacterium]